MIGLIQTSGKKRQESFERCLFKAVTVMLEKINYSWVKYLFVSQKHKKKEGFINFTFCEMYL